MGRIARVVVPEVPYHIVNRGHHQKRIFFHDSDRELFLELLKQNGERFGIDYLAYCLMDNYFHIVAIPKRKDSFAKGFAEIKRKFTMIINIRNDWQGSLWQDRFHSYPMDEAHFFCAVRYIERNPVRAGLVGRAEEYRWSSAKAHVLGKADPNFFLLEIGKILYSDNWGAYLEIEEDEKSNLAIRQHLRTGRPFGPVEFVRRIGRVLDRDLELKQPGRKKRNNLEGRSNWVKHKAGEVG